MTPAIRAAVEALETILGEQDRTEGYASLAAYDKGRAALSLLREAGERGEPVAWMAVADDGSGYRMFTAEKPTSPRSASGFLFTPLYTSLGDVQVDARRWRCFMEGIDHGDHHIVMARMYREPELHLRCEVSDPVAEVDAAMSSTPNPEQPNVHLDKGDRTARTNAKESGNA